MMRLGQLSKHVPWRHSNRRGVYVPSISPSQISYTDGFQVLNAFIEFYQLQKADAILASFLAMIPPSCRVIRGGTLSSVPAAEVSVAYFLFPFSKLPM